jgi:hypothetical protein
MGAEAPSAYSLVKARISRRRRMETNVKRPAATAVALVAKSPAANAYRLGLLGLNLGLWTLIVVIARAL